MDLPYGLAVSPSGDLYIADTGNNLVRKVGSNGVIVTVAGNGTPGFSGDGGAATNASLNDPNQLALDASGNLYIADSGNNRIRKLTPQGVITTIAGTGAPGYSGDAGPATNAALRAPFGVAVDSAGNVYISDSGNNRIRAVNSEGSIRTLAGDGAAAYGGDGGPAAGASLNSPGGIAVDNDENVFIADTLNNRVRQVSVFGVITTLAGTGIGNDSGDGGPGEDAGVSLPVGVGVDPFGNLYIAESDNNIIRQVTPGGVINTVAGDGTYGFSGDGGPPTQASLASPFTVEANPAGALFIADSGNNRIREVSLTTLPTLTLANLSFANSGVYQVIVSNPAGSVTSAVAMVTLGAPPAITAQPASQTAPPGATVTLGIVASGLAPFTYQWQFNRVNIPDEIYTVAGGGSAGYLVTGQATNASLNGPYQVTTDDDGDIFISDTNDHVIRKLTPNGVIQTIVGSGIYGFSGDGGPALKASLTYPSGLVVDAAGNLFFADVYNNRIRKVDTNGVISTIAGNGSAGPGFTGGGGPATSATLNYPVGVTLDASGNLFIADPNDMMVLKVDTRGIITAQAGTGQSGFSGDGGPATNAALNSPFAVKVDSTGNVLIADSDNYRIRKVDTNGLISTIVGNGAQGFSGDGGPALVAKIGDVNGLAMDAAGNLYFPEYDNDRVRMVNPSGLITTIAGNGASGGSGNGGPAIKAELKEPYGIALSPAGELLIGDFGNNRIRGITLTTLPTLTLTDLSTADAGGYQVIVSNPAGSVTSAVATVALGIPPAITSQPVSQSEPVGGTVSLGVVASGLAPFTYQWQFDGVNIPSQIHTVAGGGAGYLVTGQATNASLNGPYQVAADADGDIFISDTNDHVIRKLTPNGVIQTIVGSGNYGFSGDGGPAIQASLTYPSGLVVDTAGDLFFTDVFNNRIRKVDTNGVITTLAGNGNTRSGFTGGGGPATSATLNQPVGVAVDNSGNVFIADRNAGMVLKVDTRGIITAVAGNGQTGYSGDGGLATNAALNNPSGVLVDSLGNVLIADSENYRIRRVDTNGVISTIAGNGTQGFSGDGGPALGAKIGDANGLAMDAAGNLYFPEFHNNRVRMVSPNGIINTTAGNGTSGGSGDGGPAIKAQFNQPYGIASSPAEELLIGDFGNNRIRGITLATLPTLTLADLSVANAGAYTVIITNSSGSVTSSVAALTLTYPVLTVALQSGPSVLLQSQVAPNAAYFVQLATNLVAPVKWQNLGTNTADNAGHWSLTDTNLPVHATRFYRLFAP